MVGEELHDKEAQSIKEMVEEVSKAPPRKSKKKTKWKDDATLSKAQARERTFSPSLERGTNQNKGGFTNENSHHSQKI
jgi:hypothetical protein